MTTPNLHHELELWNQGFTVIGIDEVGRGAFAGPLFAAGVIFAPTRNQERITKLQSYGINDSKKLTAAKREVLNKIILKEAYAYNISMIDVAEINRIGIGKANFKAMRKVIKNLTVSLRGVPQSGTTKQSNAIDRFADAREDKYFILVDGFQIKNLKGIGAKYQKAIIGGDGISLSIAAASIIAKVARDEYMRNLGEQYSEFGWDHNKGYGTLFHRQALAKFGSTPFHRNDFIENFI